MGSCPHFPICSPLVAVLFAELRFVVAAPQREADQRRAHQDHGRGLRRGIFTAQPVRIDRSAAYVKVIHRRVESASPAVSESGLIDWRFDEPYVLKVIYIHTNR